MVPAETTTSCPPLEPVGFSQDCGVVASQASILETRKHMRAPRAHEFEGDAKWTKGSDGRGVVEVRTIS